MRYRIVLIVGAGLLALAGCSGGTPATDATEADGKATVVDTAVANPERNAYFGAVHVHTSLSFDAFTNGSRTTPADAYAWAQGQAITSSGHGPEIKIATPLDFYAVSDHAEMLGVFRQMANPESAVSKLPIAKAVLSSDPNTALQAFAQLLREMSTGKADPALTDPKLAASSWQEMIKAADDAYKPGKFTTFAAFEWTSNPDKRNLHRVVVFRDTAKLPGLPLSTNTSGDDPEALWKWMDAQRANGSTLFAIPHNGNASDGRMFELKTFAGKPLTAAYAEERMKNEPLYEISQIKGTSETWPALSPNDEFAGFELWNYTLSADAEPAKVQKGGYARQALLDGMALAQAGEGNPFKYGFIGDTDTHNAAASNEEFNYTGKFAHENIPQVRMDGLKGQPPKQIQQIREFSSGGLAGVWAEANTREAIFDAMQRKETFATSGTMIKVRLFGGWDFTAADLGAGLAKAGYARGVPMGGDLKPGTGKAPSFVVSALKDPKSGNLDRIQIVKGWIDAAGKPHEKVFDVVWAGDRKPGPDGKVPPVGNTVDVKTAKYTNSIGAADLSTVWTDPEFDPKLRAFYYARVLEIPTPRWSTYDAAKLGMPIPGGLVATIQERAWTSPIWYTPGA